MSGVNKAILIGNLGKDPEVRRTSEGSPVVTFPIATSETWRDKATGDRKERTEWHRIVIFNEGLAKVAEQYLKKGSRVFIEAPIRTRKWTAQDGGDRYTTEIVLSGFGCSLQLLDRAERSAPNEGDYGKTNTSTPSSSSSTPRPAASSGKRDDMDDEIPF